jgi:hypothetical protein
MLKAASDDESINFRLHAIELRRRTQGVSKGEQAGREAEQGGREVQVRKEAGRGVCACADEISAGEIAITDEIKAGQNASTDEILAGQNASTDEIVAGEIGFSVGRIYTSLTGWTGIRSRDGTGAAQLALLGRWLQARGYAFWSLGHCYSPQVRAKGAYIHATKGSTAIVQRWEPKGA